MQLTSIEGELSTKTTITIIYGVPQGSVLGPLLFHNINGLNEAILLSLIHHFADDINILICNKITSENTQIY